MRVVRRLIPIALGIMLYNSTETTSLSEIDAESKLTETEIVDVKITELELPTVSEPQTEETETEVEENPQYISLGEFLITAYCSCEICCDHYALNRPIDENGNEIVIGAAQQVLTPEYSIAVDTNVIPFGTKVYFNGKEYLAQDRGGSIKKKRIDLYFDDHQSALEWGKQYHEVFILVESEE